MTIMTHPAWATPRAPIRWRLPLPWLGGRRAAVVFEVIDRPVRRRLPSAPDPRFEAAEAIRRSALEARLGSGY